MSSIIYNGHEIQDLIINGNQAQLWLNGQKLYPSAEPGPVDPYNPLGLPPFTIRCKFKSGDTPTGGDSRILVDADENIWDITNNNTNWGWLLASPNNPLEVLGANTTGVTNMDGMFYTCDNLKSVPLFDTSSCTSMWSMFYCCFNLKSVPLFDTSSCTSMWSMFEYCDNLKSVPLFDTSSCTNMSSMFNGCTKVQSGALALYQQASTQATPPTDYHDCFTDCGKDTVTGAAELAQIPEIWGGLAQDVLPSFTIRCSFTVGYTPTMGDSQTLVESGKNVWDITKNNTSWSNLFNRNTNLLKVLGANTTGVTNMCSMFEGCTSLTLVPLLDTSSCTDMMRMFLNCYNVQSGALALYQQASTQATPPSSHTATFTNCGSKTKKGAAELAQIPSSWGGTGA